MDLDFGAGVSADLDAYWIDKFGIRQLTADLAGVRHARHLREALLEKQPGAVRLSRELVDAEREAEENQRRVLTLDSSMGRCGKSLFGSRRRRKKWRGAGRLLRWNGLKWRRRRGRPGIWRGGWGSRQN